MSSKSNRKTNPYDETPLHRSASWEEWLGEENELADLQAEEDALYEARQEEGRRYYKVKRKKQEANKREARQIRQAEWDAKLANRTPEEVANDKTLAAWRTRQRNQEQLWNKFLGFLLLIGLVFLCRVAILWLNDDLQKGRGGYSCGSIEQCSERYNNGGPGPTGDW